MTLTRREVLRYGASAGGALFLTWQLGVGHGVAAAAATSPSLPAADIPKYRQPLVILPAMPRTQPMVGAGGKVDYYEIAVRQFRQTILPPPLPATTVWSYGSVNHPGTFSYPAFTIEASSGLPVRVKWINELIDPTTGRFLPHLLPVDPTLHWANPPGGNEGRDERPTFSSTPGPYRGPVPVVTHLHGGERTPQESDGFPEAWYLPDASNIPSRFATTGTFYDIFKASSPLGARWSPGAAVFEYPNEQRATTLWYHDHVLGMTRANIYMGLAGFYLLRGGPGDVPGGQLPGPAPALGDPPGTSHFEIPLAIQDRSFDADGSLFYPDSREFFDGFAGPFIPESDIPPIWNPEFLGDAIVVNGRTWPFLEVEQRRYRFRILNACNVRFLILELDNDLPFWQIGTDGGFLPAPVRLSRLLISPAERADVIVDFTDVPVGTEIILRNLGPDEPFGGGEPGVDFHPANPDTTGQVMRFQVVSSRHRDTSTAPDRLELPELEPLGEASETRKLSLNEEDSAVLPGVGPRATLLGTLNPDGTGHPLEWADPITENPAAGATEIWELHNFTNDAHSIHIHRQQFQVVNRQPFDGEARPPESWETGFKDTVIANPDEITRVKARFHGGGLFVWHCHMLEHEDNEMMRRYFIGQMP